MKPINYLFGFLLVFCLGSQLLAQNIALKLGADETVLANVVGVAARSVAVEFGTGEVALRNVVEAPIRVDTQGVAEKGLGDTVEVPIRIDTDQNVSSLEIAVAWDGSRAIGVQLKDLIVESGAPGELVHKVRVESDHAIFVVALNPASGFVAGPGNDIHVATLELRCLTGGVTRPSPIVFADNTYFATDGAPFPIVNRVGGGSNAGGTFEIDRTTEPALRLLPGILECSSPPVRHPNVSLKVGEVTGGPTLEVPLLLNTDENVSSLEIAVEWDERDAVGVGLKDLIVESGAPGELVHRVRVESNYAIFVVALNPSSGFVAGPGTDIHVATLELNCLRESVRGPSPIVFADNTYFATDGAPFPIVNRVGGGSSTRGTFEIDRRTTPALRLLPGTLECSSAPVVDANVSLSLGEVTGGPTLEVPLLLNTDENVSSLEIAVEWDERDAVGVGLKDLIVESGAPGELVHRVRVESNYAIFVVALNPSSGFVAGPGNDILVATLELRCLRESVRGPSPIVFADNTYFATDGAPFPIVNRVGGGSSTTGTFEIDRRTTPALRLLPGTLECSSAPVVDANVSLSLGEVTGGPTLEVPLLLNTDENISSLEIAVEWDERVATGVGLKDLIVESGAPGELVHRVRVESNYAIFVVALNPSSGFVARPGNDILVATLELRCVTGAVTRPSPIVFADNTYFATDGAPFPIVNRAGGGSSAEGTFEIDRRTTPALRLLPGTLECSSAPVVDANVSLSLGEVAGGPTLEVPLLLNTDENISSLEIAVEWNERAAVGVGLKDLIVESGAPGELVHRVRVESNYAIFVVALNPSSGFVAGPGNDIHVATLELRCVTGAVTRPSPIVFADNTYFATDGAPFPIVNRAGGGSNAGGTFEIDRTTEPALRLLPGALECSSVPVTDPNVALKLSEVEGGATIEVPLLLNTDENVSSLEIAVEWDESAAVGVGLKDLIVESGAPGELIHRVRVERNYAIYVVGLNPATSFVTGPGNDIHVATLELSCAPGSESQSSGVAFVDRTHFPTDGSPFPITNRVGGRFRVGGTFEADRNTLPALELTDGSFRCGGEEPETFFKRGDTDGSGDVDFTDAILSLYFLFLGTFTPTCLDASDANDDGMVDFTDSIFLLVWLFLEGDAGPPEPGPFACGIDPTDNSSPNEGGEEPDCEDYPLENCARAP